MLHGFLKHFSYTGNSEKQSHQYRLIYYITGEAIAVSIVFLTLYLTFKLWILLAILLASSTLSLLNLWVLHRTKKTVLCGHIFTFLIFITIISTNYITWGSQSLPYHWFYVMPVLAASLTGIGGLAVYVTISVITLIGLGKLTLLPYYALPPYLILMLRGLSLSFAYAIIVTTLASLIHENKRYEQELKNKNDLLQKEKDNYLYLAQFDHLTNLPNRRYFIQHLHELINSLEPNYCVTVFFIDLDNFKFINDCYGHNIGDQVLLETSRRLTLCFGDSDFIARLGGDEFTAIVLHTANTNIPQAIAQKVIHEFEPEFKLAHDKEYHYAISMGFATYPHDAKTASELMIKADLAMYSAKKIRGNSFSP